LARLIFFVKQPQAPDILKKCLAIRGIVITSDVRAVIFERCQVECQARMMNKLPLDLFRGLAKKVKGKEKKRNPLWLH
jgi:hypothetical protein